MNVVRRFLVWAVIAGGMSAALVYGTQRDVQWAHNIGVFGVWLYMGRDALVVMSLFMADYAHRNQGGPDPAAWITPPLPRVLRPVIHVFAFAMLAYLAALGWFVTAFAWAGTMLLDRVGAGKLGEIRKRAHQQCDRRQS